MVLDHVADEQFLLVKTQKGLVVILGCSHRGIINMLEYARVIGKERRICLVVGGMHLMRSGKARVRKVIDALKAIRVDKIAPCHCTGPDAIAALKDAFPRRFIPCSTGDAIEL